MKSTEVIASSSLTPVLMGVRIADTHSREEEEEVYN